MLRKFSGRRLRRPQVPGCFDDLAADFALLRGRKLHWRARGRGTILSSQTPFGFDDGSRLFLSSFASSAAPVVAVITHDAGQCIVDQEENVAIVYERRAGSNRPLYHYGADFSRSSHAGIETVQWGDVTRAWLRSLDGQTDCILPTLNEAAIGHELLFDLLEVTGETEFPIT